MQRSAFPSRIEPGTLAFDADGHALSPFYGDVYSSRDGALGQARHVFLAGNALPQRWRGRRSFTILETGFGLGTNFLATWQAWRAAELRCERLHYLALERHPLAATDLARACGAALREPMAMLIAQWPDPIAGLHRLEFDDGRVVLTLALGAAHDLAPQLGAGVDAFYLDGFAPGNNPDMWSPALLKALARLARDEATLATWCTARGVREALEACGFALDLRDGYGRKRHMLAGSFAPRWRTRRHAPGAAHAGQRQALVIGAGLAGSVAAQALARRDWSVTVLERAAGPAQEASALPWGLLHPQMSRDDNLASRLARAGLRCSLQALRRTAGASWQACGVFELAADFDAGEAPALLAAQGLPPGLAQWCSAVGAADHVGVLPGAPGWWYPQAGVVAVRDWCARLLAHARIQFQGCCDVATLDQGAAGWTARDVDGRVLASAPVVIVANAHDAARLLGARHLPLQSIGGRVSVIDAPLGLRAALAGAGTLLQAPDGSLLLGATYEAQDEAPLTTERAHRANLARLPRMLAAPVAAQVRAVFAGSRSVARDRQPYAGAVADEALAQAQRALLRGAQLPDVPRRAGLYLTAAFGSRGLLLAPLAAELIAAQIDGEPWPVERALAAALDPARYLLRALRRAPQREPPPPEDA